MTRHLEIPNTLTVDTDVSTFAQRPYIAISDTLDTIVVDAEHLDALIAALTEAKAALA